MPNVAEILKQIYGAVVQRDFAAARQYLADDLTFIGLFETYPSAEYLKALSGLMQITVRPDVKKIIAEGEDAAIFFELQTTAPAEATVLVAEWHQFKDGKIVRAQSAFDARPNAALFTGGAR
jgi:hypothetical protein